jgi:hypothetical protein
VDALKPPTEMKERWKVIEKMALVPQYAFAGDYTGQSLSPFCCCRLDCFFPVEAIEKGVNDVGAFDAG